LFSFLGLKVNKKNINYIFLPLSSPRAVVFRRLEIRLSTKKDASINQKPNQSINQLINHIYNDDKHLVDVSNSWPNGWTEWAAAGPNGLKIFEGTHGK